MIFLKCHLVVYMLSCLNITNKKYSVVKPYPYYSQPHFLEETFATALQKEILELPLNHFDRYNNPFEEKYTLRDKYNFPPLLKKLFSELESVEFVSHLSEIVGERLLLDTTRNFWGVHVYKENDKLDIHVDAGIHPTLGLKKHVTFGIYLSKNWKDTFGCELEIWNGTNACENDAKIIECVDRVIPHFNTAVLFTCNDYSWHGNPVPATCDGDARRVFITISYLSENFSCKNMRDKAFFVPRPCDEPNDEKDRLRLLRASSKTCNQVYNIVRRNAD